MSRITEFFFTFDVGFTSYIVAGNRVGVAGSHAYLVPERKRLIFAATI